VKVDDNLLKAYAFWNLNKAYMDKNLIFRNNYTGELLMFDKDGFWNPEGLSHPLIY